jgi:ribokinase
LTICARLPPRPQLTVVGSINLDLVAKVERLPRPGETITASSFERIPGGKGANQAVAAARLGTRVRFIGAVGRDDFGREALVNLRELDLDIREVDAPTGVALIVVDDEGDNEIVIVPGANDHLRQVTLSYKAALCQLEVPDAAIEQARTQAEWLCVNAAPARPLTVRADLVVANRYELDVIGPQRGLVALTLGEEGAVLLEDGREIARATPPTVKTVDGTAAGDAFTACLVVSHLEGRPWDEALRRACAAGAIAASRFGAQPSLPAADEVDSILTER